MAKTYVGMSNTGRAAVVRARDIDALVITDMGETTPERPYNVAGYVPSGVAVVVAGPFTPDEAAQYIATDPDRIL